MTLQTVQSIEYLVAFIFSVLFIYDYFRTEWRKHEWSKHYMRYVLWVTSILSLRIIDWLFDPGPWWPYAVTLTLFGFTCECVYRWWITFRARHKIQRKGVRNGSSA